MIRSRRLRRSFIACLAALLGLAVVVVPGVPPARAVGADDTILGPARVTATQMAAWFRARTTSPYQAGVPLGELAALYLSEGNRAGVRGDIAFAQSILETRWFSFPAGGMLIPAQNNFAGIGACDSCVTGLTFATVQLGVRAQMQQLRRYADPTSRSWNIGASPVQPLWPNDASYDLMNRTHGWAPTWQSLSGTWATAPSYAATISQLYNSMWIYAGQPGANVWSPWTSAGGVLTSAPAVASWKPNRLDLFVRGDNGALWHQRSNYGVWYGWESFGAPPVGLAADDPAAVAPTSGQIDVFVRGNDNHLWHRLYDGTTLQPWEDLGGSISSGPAVASWAADRLDLFARGPAGDLLHRFRIGTSWSAWESLGGGLVGTPAAVSWAADRVDVFVRGTDNQLWQRVWNSTSWSGWIPQGGQLRSGPAVASWAPGRLDVFVAGTDAQLWHNYFDGQWHAYNPLGGTLTSAPSAVSWAKSRIDVFARGTDSQSWYRFWSS
ncbi:MAG: glucosaminidase domain-containing protein [Acidimicrobiia bacterium]